MWVFVLVWVTRATLQILHVYTIKIKYAFLILYQQRLGTFHETKLIFARFYVLHRFIKSNAMCYIRL